MTALVVATDYIHYTNWIRKHFPNRVRLPIRELMFVYGKGDFWTTKGYARGTLYIQLAGTQVPDWFAGRFNMTTLEELLP